MFKKAYQFRKEARQVYGTSLNTEPKCHDWPQLSSHCNGYGGSLGPTAEQISRVYTMTTASLALIGDGIMQATGGSTLKEDTTFWAAGTVSMDLSNQNVRAKLVKGLHAGIHV